ncbi:MAG: hypothetical protein RLN75_07795 [Longimicrobiales bacterium]
MKPRPIPALICFALGVMLAACGGGRQGGSQSDPNTLTRAELQATDAADLHTAISRLRPRWLQARNERTALGAATIGVFLDGVRDMRGVRLLYDMRPNEVIDVRFMNARDAQTRYGTNLQGGAILIRMRR